MLWNSRQKGKRRNERSRISAYPKTRKYGIMVRPLPVLQPGPVILSLPVATILRL
jgi:hypothetical protein